MNKKLFLVIGILGSVLQSNGAVPVNVQRAEMVTAVLDSIRTLKIQLDREAEHHLLDDFDHEFRILWLEDNLKRALQNNVSITTTTGVTSDGRSMAIMDYVYFLNDQILLGLIEESHRKVLADLINN